MARLNTIGSSPSSSADCGDSLVLGDARERSAHPGGLDLLVEVFPHRPSFLNALGTERAHAVRRETNRSPRVQGARASARSLDRLGVARPVAGQPTSPAVDPNANDNLRSFPPPEFTETEIDCDARPRPARLWSSLYWPQSRRAPRRCVLDVEAWCSSTKVLSSIPKWPLTTTDPCDVAHMISGMTCRRQLSVPRSTVAAERATGGRYHRTPTRREADACDLSVLGSPRPDV